MELLHACPPSCKRLRIDDDTAGAAERRLRALELVDERLDLNRQLEPETPARGSFLKVWKYSFWPRHRHIAPFVYQTWRTKSRQQT